MQAISSKVSCQAAFAARPAKVTARRNAVVTRAAAVAGEVPSPEKRKIMASAGEGGGGGDGVSTHRVHTNSHSWAAPTGPASPDGAPARSHAAAATHSKPAAGGAAGAAPTASQPSPSHWRLVPCPCRTCCCWALLAPPLWAWPAPTPCSSCPPGVPLLLARQLHTGPHARLPARHQPACRLACAACRPPVWPALPHSPACSAGGGGGGTVAKDALGNDVKASSWLKTHPAGDRSLSQGLKARVQPLLGPLWGLPRPPAAAWGVAGWAGWWARSQLQAAYQAAYQPEFIMRPASEQAWRRTSSSSRRQARGPSQCGTWRLLLSGAAWFRQRLAWVPPWAPPRAAVPAAVAQTAERCRQHVCGSVHRDACAAEGGRSSAGAAGRRACCAPTSATSCDHRRRSVPRPPTRHLFCHSQSAGRRHFYLIATLVHPI